ncbi:angiopoietin-related protein 1-like [Branchiostoma floridae x Branchiostoma japonicum]
MPGDQQPSQTSDNADRTYQVEASGRGALFSFIRSHRSCMIAGIAVMLSLVGVGLAPLTFINKERDRDDMRRDLDKERNRTAALEQRLYEMSKTPDCDDVYKAGNTTSGVYTIQPDAAGALFRVYCEMEAGAGGWTVLQKRFDGSVDFANDWETYKNGFGDLSSEFWLGNDKIYQISNEKAYLLRIDLENWSSETVYAEYDSFYIEDEAAKYRLHVGTYSGTAGDGGYGLSYHDGSRFSTHDQDNDGISGHNCANIWGGRGGWWYNACNRANLNQPYKHGGGGTDRHGIEWTAWTAHQYSIKSSVMKIRPAP